MNVFCLVPRFKSYLLHKNVYRMLRWQSTRNILGEIKCINYQKTLNGRMLLYLNGENNKRKPSLVSNKSINNLVSGNKGVLKNFNIDDIANLFYSAEINKLNYDIKQLNQLLKTVDVECSLRLHNLELSNILKILNEFMQLVPHNIKNYQLYKSFINNLDSYIKTATQEELLQIIFYLGIEKKNDKTFNHLKSCLHRVNKEFLDKLTIEDLCIICNSTQRRSAKLTEKKILEKIKQTLHENLFLLKDVALLMTFIKTLRSNHWQDEDLLNTISCTIFFNNTIQYYNFTSMSYILALFADYFYYEERLLDLFIERCINELKNKDFRTAKNRHLTEIMRAKDITHFLWALSILDYERADINVLKNLIIPKIEERVAIKEFHRQPHQLIKAILSLWMLNCRPKKLIFSALTEENLTKIRGNVKYNASLDLLLTCIQLEDPKLFDSLGVTPTGTSSFNYSMWQAQSRPVFTKIFDTLKCISGELKIDKFEVDAQVPYLNIVGITGYQNDKKAVYIEVLDEFTSLKNKDCCPTGLMNLKLRLLDTFKVPLVTISKTEVDDMSDGELKEYLFEDVNMVLKFL